MNNSSIIRQLKKLSKNSTNVNPEKPTNASTNLIAFLALIISLLSMYFQFFYERFDLNASLIDVEIKKDTIGLNLIYHNKGNQDATIISSEIYFYSDKNKNIMSNYIQFINKKQEPYILSPGKQIFKNFIQKVHFDEDDILKRNWTKNKDTLRVELIIKYLRDNSLQAEKRIKCGWITLDSINKINSWFINYQKIELDSDEYFISTYSSTK